MSMYILKKGDSVYLRHAVSLKAYDIQTHEMLLGSVDTGEVFRWPASAPPFNMPSLDWPVYIKHEHVGDDFNPLHEVIIEQGRFWFYFPENFSELYEDGNSSYDFLSSYYAVPYVYDPDEVTDANIMTLEGVKLFTADVENYKTHNAIVETYRARVSEIRKLEMTVHKIFAQNSEGEISSALSNNTTDRLDLDVFIAHIHQELRSKDESEWDFLVLVKVDSNYIKLPIEYLCIGKS